MLSSEEIPLPSVIGIRSAVQRLGLLISTTPRGTLPGNTPASTKQVSPTTSVSLPTIAYKMAPAMEDPSISKIHPRIRYNTVGGVNGPLVILDNVSRHMLYPIEMDWQLTTIFAIGQISSVQRDRVLNPPRWHGTFGASARGTRYVIDVWVGPDIKIGMLIYCMLQETERWSR